ncbi:sensor histidine kinase [Methylophaga sp. OBS4]|uniref:sensor histidine kinase n=1 Tax=Methylophaga sp. OBS4 TaxID=2991935 RepID=UPI0022595107|nr:sensor histidine kinase [Methylophaga sp. OBS4]MCX4188397.1 ATP-binding protein [Methylophaga sp. OBS4]
MKLFKKFHTIQASLLLHELSFVFLIFITASVGIVWAFAWQQSSEESLRLTTMNNYVQNIRGELYRQLKEVFDASFLNDSDAADEYDHYTRRINTYLHDLQLLTTDSDEAAVTMRIYNAYARFHRETNKLLLPTNLTSQQKHMLDNQLEQYTFTELETAFSQFDRLLQDRQRILVEDRQKWMSHITLLVPVPVLLAITLLLFSRRYVKNNVVRPLAAVMQGARLISKGDLQHKIRTSGVDDLIRLADAINTMADELATNRDKLVEAKKQAALGELVPLVAHNIRNPLAGIRAASQVTLDDNVAPSTRDALRDIIVAVDRLERWVTSLLTYLHPLKPHFSANTLTKVADNALSLIELQLADKPVKLERRGWTDAAAIVSVDNNLMEQTIFNLVQNAIEASPTNSTIVLIYQQTKDSVQLLIADEGNGMQFDPVSEQVTDGEAKRLGCGLGIPFALKVVKQHGGEIIYDSAKQKGTRVTIRLKRTHSTAP